MELRDTRKKQPPYPLRGNRGCSFYSVCNQRADRFFRTVSAPALSAATPSSAITIPAPLSPVEGDFAYVVVGACVEETAGASIEVVTGVSPVVAVDSVEPPVW